ncbi:Phosphonate ABC transporter permease protein phnE2 [Alkalibacterium sp. AK22]|uniref:phosphonate ABC transporter, permease protein PhnE n=1 Tax=Alkalibacterium sp. AK22 TaxID=1229520 RepID=UPI00044999E6|nr:phosphonate ABC transporter, permease protein PhnE [Alkalibacterium sp. AK22]EXJ24432.1 Phosphonate ABC transporter permease protein phnE2 [Alkalibacterium sp. AK22]
MEKSTAKKNKIRLFKPGTSFKIFGVVLAVLSLYWAAINQTQASLNRILSSFPILYRMLVEDFFPPDFSYLPRVVSQLVETFNIALLSTTLAAFLAFPMLFFSSSTVNRNPLSYSGIRLVMTVVRSIPNIIMVVLMVALVGLGPVSGIIALTVYSAAILIKLTSESVETIDKRPIQAIKAMGGNTLQTIAYGVVPQIFPVYLSHILYVLEVNLKASVVLGFVGAGGIGQLIRRQMSLFRYDRLGLIIFVLFLAISTIDYISQTLRSKLV